MKTDFLQTILYMDDDADDVELLQQAINTIDSTYQMQIASDGNEGLAQLFAMKRTGRLPRLIVLDINMPRLDGKMTYVKIKEDPQLATIPVVIFSTSNSALDRLFFQNHHVEYITKPIQFDHLVAVAKRLLAYVRQ